jgi:5-methylcytosine-specific restriction endonuclease McrA
MDCCHLELEQLINKIKNLEEENNTLKEHLKKYTAPSRSKSYYENHKEEIKQKVKNYKENTNYTPTQDQKREWAKRAYQKKKEKLKEALLNNNI